MNKIDFGALSKRQESIMSLPKRRSSPVKAMMHGNNAVTHGYSNQCKTSFHQLHQVLKTLVFFCDGMSWSYILPSGPTVLFRWFQPGATKSLWSILLATPSTSFSLASSSYTNLYAIYHYLESVIAVYVLGRCLGKVISKQFQFAQTRSNYSIRVARVVTATLFVHVFAAGIVPQAWTVVLRLVTAILAGMLCDMTSIASLGEVIVHAVWNFCTAAKVHWIGFVTCVLLTSFIRAHQAIFLTPLTVIGFCVAVKLLFSPFFLTGVAIGAEIILRFLFAFTPNHQTTIPRQISTTTTRQPETGRNIRSNSISSNRQGSFKTSRSRPSIEVRTSRNSVSSSLRRPSRQSSAEPKPDSNSTNSSFSSLEESEHAAHPTAVSYDSEVCIYRDRQCVYPDGTPAYVPQGDCVNTVPPNFLEFYSYDHARARRAWEATQEWRRTNNVWRIHTLPNHWFPRIKEAYPHFVHGHSKAGFPIVYEQPGRMRLKELFRSGCQIDDMIFHYQFLMEFFSNIICKREEVRSLSSQYSSGDVSNWGLMVVMDVQGFGLGNLSKDVLSYLKQAGEVNKSHYPLCTKRAFVVKTSVFLAGAWSGLKGILPDTVQVDILSESKYLNSLREFIDDDQIPPEYGGSSPYRLGSHPYELSLRQLVEERLSNNSDDEER